MIKSIIELCTLIELVILLLSTVNRKANVVDVFHQYLRLPNEFTHKQIMCIAFGIVCRIYNVYGDVSKFSAFIYQQIDSNRKGTKGSINNQNQLVLKQTPFELIMKTIVNRFESYVQDCTNKQ